ncbi:MAG: hypothetical protein EPO26_11315 [Chloroflexota bacterium]|nr:MAG: hypothetical protein EPO26_11315 [Chloroflexota bacterium]
MSEHGRREVPPDVEAALALIAAIERPEDRARLLANSINRAISQLHRLARDEATARKGSRDWAAWAKLVNASRNAVLAASMCREVATAIGTSAVPTSPETESP